MTVYNASSLHKAIGEYFSWQGWLRKLPGHPPLHNKVVAHPGLDGLVDQNINEGTVFASGSRSSDMLVMAPDVHFTSAMVDNPAKGGIIFEMAYPQEAERVREKAKRFLIGSSVPRPSVVVIYDFVSRGSGQVVRDLEVHFEVLRRDPARPDRLKTYEKGVSLPPECVWNAWPNGTL